MKTKNKYWIIAGFLNLFTFFLHLIGGQIGIVKPMMASNMPYQAQTEMLGAWHIVSAFLLISSIYYLKYGFGRIAKSPHESVKVMSYSYIAFGLVFLVNNLVQSLFTGQWILLAPIGILGLVGLKKLSHDK